MFVGSRPDRKSGRVMLVFRESYRDGKRVASRIVQELGYLDELEKEYDDPVAHFTKLAKQLTAEKKANRELQKVEISATMADKLEPGSDATRNIGYLVLSQIYHELEIPRFMANRQRSRKLSYQLNEVFKLLVFGQAIYPGSKQQIYKRRARFFDKPDFELDSVYRSLSLFASFSEDLTRHLHGMVAQQYGRDSERVYYDVTNYYFEIDEEDRLRRRGASKEKRRSPIVQMGLLMDENGLPITYRLFPGNTVDCETLMETIDPVRSSYGVGRVVVVADRGLNTAENMAYAELRGDGYVYGQSILRAPKEMKDYALEPSHYRSYNEDGQLLPPAADDDEDRAASYRIKSRLYPREVKIRNKDNRLVPVVLHQKQVFYYSAKYAAKARREREQLLEKARRLIQQPGSYQQAKDYGAAKYVLGCSVDPETKQLVPTKETLMLDVQRIQDEERYDGYYAIVTSELDKDDRQVVEMYRGLWDIEHLFRLSKNEFRTRPVYVSREERIQAHFLICFVVLLLVRILHLKLDKTISVETLMDELRELNSTRIQGKTYLQSWYSEVTKMLKQVFDIPYDRRFLNENEIKRYRKPG